MNQLDLVKKCVLEHFQSKKANNKHYSYRTHAKFLGVSISTYSSYVSGKRELSLSLLKKISEKLSDLYPELKVLEATIEPQRLKLDPIEIKKESYKIRIHFLVTASGQHGAELAKTHIDRIRNGIEAI